MRTRKERGSREAARAKCRGAGRAYKESVIQSAIDKSVQAHLEDRRSGYRGRVLTRWVCRACGPRLGQWLRRNGHYQRRPLTAEGIICLRIPPSHLPQLQPECAVHPSALPRHRRPWLDLDQQLLLLYLEGCSYRAAKRLLERKCKSSIGLMSPWRSFQASGSRHAPQKHAPSHYLALDEVYHRIGSEHRWLLSARG